MQSLTKPANTSSEGKKTAIQFLSETNWSLSILSSGNGGGGPTMSEELLFTGNERQGRERGAVNYTTQNMYRYRGAVNYTTQNMYHYRGAVNYTTQNMYRYRGAVNYTTQNMYRYRGAVNYTTHVFVCASIEVQWITPHKTCISSYCYRGAVNYTTQNMYLFVPLYRCSELHHTKHVFLCIAIEVQWITPHKTCICLCRYRGEVNYTTQNMCLFVSL